jgi:hypothetical protein
MSATCDLPTWNQMATFQAKSAEGELMLAAVQEQAARFHVATSWWLPNAAGLLTETDIRTVVDS